MMVYINLNRQFSVLPLEDNKDRLDSEEVAGATTLLGSLDWNQLLELNRVVILAEAGAGKTVEIKEKARQLRHGGYSAFFMRLEFLAEGISSFEDSFDESTFEEFLNWETSGKIGYFFLDSVDEARLKSPSDFEKALRVLSNKLKGNLIRTKIFITSRISEWRPIFDLQLFKQYLPISFVTPKDNDKNRVEEEYKVAILNGLSELQIEEFASFRDVKDIVGFIRELDRQEAFIFAKRPLDLEELIEFWRHHSRIGTRYELIENSIRQKLVDPNANLASMRQITEAKLLEGIELVAAIVTLQKQSRIHLSSTRGLTTNLHIDSILPNWLPHERSTLLKIALFDEEIYGAVRFHHRVVREFLTAQWLIKLLREGKSRRAIESLFFQEQYGLAVTVPTMRPVVAWVALLDNQILEKLISIDPQTLIEYGDPKRISLPHREKIIENCCFQYIDKTISNKEKFNFSTLEKFASPDLSDICLKLFDKYPYDYEISRFLVKIIDNGKIVGCKEKIFEVSFDEKYGSYVRSLAIRAFDSIMNKEQFLDFTKKWLNKNKLDIRLAYSILGSDYGEFIHSDEILLLLNKISQEIVSIENMSTFGHYLQNWIKGNIDLDFSKILNKLLEFVDKYPKVRQSHRDYDNTWAFECLAVVVTVIAQNKRKIDLTENLHRALAIIANYSDEYFFARGERLELRQSVENWEDLNRSQLWYDIDIKLNRMLEQEKIINSNILLTSFKTYALLNSKDFDYLIDVCTTSNSSIRKEVAFELAYRLYISSNRRWEWYKKIYKIIEDEAIFYEKFKYLRSNRKIKKIRIKNMKYNKRKFIHERNKKYEHVKTKENLIKNLEKIRGNPYPLSSKIWNCTRYLLEYIRFGEKRSLTTEKYGSLYWDRLIPAYGTDVAHVFRDGAKGYWRLNIPSLASENKKKFGNTCYTTMYGLMGLAIEAQDDPNWFERITRHEAEIAIRYALHEINGLPDWLNNLYNKFPDILKNIILKEVMWEVKHTPSDRELYYVIRNVSDKMVWLHADIVMDIYDILKKIKIKNLNLIRYFLKILFFNNKVDNLEIIKLINCNVVAKDSLPTIWNALKLIFEPEVSINYLSKFLDNLSEVEAEKYIGELIIFVFGEKSGSLSKKVGSLFNSPMLLAELYLLVCKYIRYEDDIYRPSGKAYSPNFRDNIEGARGAIFGYISKLKGKDTFNAWQKIAQGTTQQYIAEAAYEYGWKCACESADMRPWDISAIHEFSKEAEFRPQNSHQLFNLVEQRLIDLKDDLEKGDTSLAPLLVEHVMEVKHRLYIGGWLRDRSHGRYVVPQEEELANAQRPDIRIHGLGFDAPIPIELKIAGKWSGNVLFERLRNQLIGDYLRDQRSTRGVFLLVNTDISKRWEITLNDEIQKISFTQLIIKMQEYADNLVINDPTVEQIRVIGVDLTIRSLASK